MRKLKVLTAAVIVLSMLFTVAFAAVNFGGETVEYTEGEDLVVSVYCTDDIAVDGGAYINVAYGEAWEYKEVRFAEGFTDGEVYEDVGYVSVTLDAAKSSANSVSLKANQPLFDVVFTATGEADAVGSSIDFYDDEFFTSNWDQVAYSGSIKVVAAGPVGPVVSEQPTTATATSKEVVVNDVTYEDVYVAEGTATVTGTITEDKKVYIKPLIFDNGVAHGDYAKVLVPGTFTGENPTIGFKIAIIGAPEDAVITAGGTITIE